MWHKKIIILVVVVAILVGLIRGPFSGVREVADESVQLHLWLTGASIYEYNAATGKWPMQNGDLAMTSWAVKSPHWKYLIDQELIVVLWHKGLKPDPRDNADRILAYYNKGLISARGKNWVCWGDLRTEYIKTEDLQVYLKNLKE